MNPSYVRLQVVRPAAMERFSAWLGLPEMEPPTVVHSSEAVDRAVTDGAWRGVSFLVFEHDDWTAFDDMTGILSTKTSADWLRLAADDRLVFAGYNDAVPCGQLVEVREGKIVRNFLDDQQDPTHNVNEGRLGFEGIYPINTWVEAASFVDGDDQAGSQDYGTLWIFRAAS